MYRSQLHHGSARDLRLRRPDHPAGVEPKLRQLRRRCLCLGSSIRQVRALCRQWRCRRERLRSRQCCSRRRLPPDHRDRWPSPSRRPRTADCILAAKRAGLAPRNRRPEPLSYAKSLSGQPEDRLPTAWPVFRRPRGRSGTAARSATIAGIGGWTDLAVWTERGEVYGNAGSQSKLSGISCPRFPFGCGKRPAWADSCSLPNQKSYPWCSCMECRPTCTPGRPKQTRARRTLARFSGAARAASKPR